MPRTALLFFTATLLISSHLQAAGPSASVLAGTCATCHGIDGKNAGSVPSIGGMDMKNLKEALLAFKSDERKATIMNRIAKGYTDKEIDAVARFLATRK